MRDTASTLTNLVRVYSRNIHTKFEANMCIRLREVKNVILHSNV